MDNKKVSDLTIKELENVLYRQNRIVSGQQYKGLMNSISRLLEQHEQIILKRIDQMESLIHSKIPDLD